MKKIYDFIDAFGADNEFEVMETLLLDKFKTGLEDLITELYPLLPKLSWYIKCDFNDSDGSISAELNPKIEEGLLIHYPEALI